jgi:uncharacterized protein (DUF3820 family)
VTEEDRERVPGHFNAQLHWMRRGGFMGGRMGQLLTLDIWIAEQTRVEGIGTRKMNKGMNE